MAMTQIEAFTKVLNDAGHSAELADDGVSVVFSANRLSAQIVFDDPDRTSWEYLAEGVKVFGVPPCAAGNKKALILAEKRAKWQAMCAMHAAGLTGPLPAPVDDFKKIRI